jgi:hypothetical protein
MVSKLLVRGMLVGLAAGVLGFVVARLLGESQVGQAIAFEDARYAAGGLPSDPALVSRTVQTTLGLATALLVFSVAIGGLFALAYACVQGRLGALGARPTAALVALGGFVGAYLLPALKYPPNPPSVGNPATIGPRTVDYLGMLVISVLAVVGSSLAARRLTARFGGWNAALLGGAAGVALVAVAYVVLPAVHETPPGFPADVLWRFRVASVGINATVWATVGLGFGALTERSLRRAQPAASRAGATQRTGR